MVDSVSAIVVTHNSSEYLMPCLEALQNQTHSIAEIVIVDCGSDDTSYLNQYKVESNIVVVYSDNVGFSTANNLGLKHRRILPDYTVFINPDTFLTPSFVRDAIAILKKSEDIAIVSGKLMGFDIKKNKATGKIDSTGIFRTLYGRWYDRGQKSVDRGQFNYEEKVPALCGALLFCKNDPLTSLGDSVFDEDFFLYKEDIELCLRLKKLGWHFLYHPDLVAYHCRGWSTNRNKISFTRRLLASYNEILLYKKHPSPYIFWAVFKYILVKIIKI